jgi:hypothetical protein
MRVGRVYRVQTYKVGNKSDGSEHVEKNVKLLLRLPLKCELHVKKSRVEMRTPIWNIYFPDDTLQLHAAH